MEGVAAKSLTSDLPVTGVQRTGGLIGYLNSDFTTANVGGMSVAANRIVRFSTTASTWHGIGDGTEGKRIAGVRRVHPRNEPEPQFPADWVDLDEEAAFAHVLAGNSLYIEAHAGAGKRHFLRKRATALRGQGKTVQMCALTHVATANLRDKGAMTLARLTHS
jgi:hypothetical protein